MFAVTMAELGLDPAYGGYVERLPGSTLATVNLISLFGLRRRWRGALVGHLAGFEISSPGPERPLRAGGSAGWDSARPQPTSTTSTSRPTRCTRTSRRTTSPAGSPARSPSSAGQIMFGLRALLLCEAPVRRPPARGASSAGEARCSTGAAPGPAERRGRRQSIGSRAARGLEADQLVGAVAKRLHPRSAAATEGDRPRRASIGLPVGVGELELAADQIGPVRIGGDACTHPRSTRWRPVESLARSGSGPPGAADPAPASASIAAVRPPRSSERSTPPIRSRSGSRRS